MLQITNIQRVSTSATGNEANGNSITPTFSPDGNKIAFVSYASNLVTGDTNGNADIFVKDLATGELHRVSTDSAGNQGNSHSYNPAFTPDGKTLVFNSSADNFLTGDTNGSIDAFFKNLESQEIHRQLNSSGKQGNNATFSSDGEHTILQQVFSSDGNKFVFTSFASNFMTSKDTNGASDVFIKDFATGAIQTITNNAEGVQANNNSMYAVISPDGNKVVFYTEANNLVEGSTARNVLVLKDLPTGSTQILASEGQDPVFSPDSSKILFTSSDASLGGIGIYIQDLNTGVIKCVSVNETGERGDFGGGNSVFSPDGTKIAFISTSRNLIEGHDDYFGKVFIKDLVTGELVTTNEELNLKYPSNNFHSQGAGVGLSFSVDGSKLAFTSNSDTFVPDDTNGKSDVFVMTLEDKPLEGTAGETQHGGEHADRITGTDNNDSLYGGEGRDKIVGGLGHDRLYGESGDDTLLGGDGNDTLNGGASQDLIYGEEGNDRLLGGSAEDTLRGGLGNDVLLGGSADDSLDGGEGNDTIYGGTGGDELRGRTGDDALYGDKGNDDLRGGEGNDTLNGGLGKNKLLGEGGADMFVFNAGDMDGAAKHIRDFNAAEGDKIQLVDLHSSPYFVGNPADFLRITISGQDSILNTVRDSTNPYWPHEIISPVCIIENHTGLNLQDMLSLGQIELI